MMSKPITIYLFIAAFLLNSCATSQLAGAWKAQNINRKVYHKIMVVGILKTPDTALRRKLEAHFVNDLNGLGYKAVSALEEYGPQGLANMNQEATYMKLCTQGIDALITIALLDKTKVNQEPHNGAKYKSALFFYNHIWNYRNTQAELTDPSQYTEQAKQFFLESILFDLQVLEPLFVVQTKPFGRTSFNSIQQNYGEAVINNMLRLKVLKKQPKRLMSPAKAF